MQNQYFVGIRHSRNTQDYLYYLLRTHFPIFFPLFSAVSKYFPYFAYFPNIYLSKKKKIIHKPTQKNIYNSQPKESALPYLAQKNTMHGAERQ